MHSPVGSCGSFTRSSAGALQLYSKFDPPMSARVNLMVNLLNLYCSHHRADTHAPLPFDSPPAPALFERRPASGSATPIHRMPPVLRQCVMPGAVIVTLALAPHASNLPPHTVSFARALEPVSSNVIRGAPSPPFISVSMPHPLASRGPTPPPPHAPPRAPLSRAAPLACNPSMGVVGSAELREDVGEPLGQRPKVLRLEERREPAHLW